MMYSSGFSNNSNSSYRPQPSWHAAHTPPNSRHCGIDNCRVLEHHTTETHKCEYFACNGYGHGVQTCPVQQEANRFRQQEKVMETKQQKIQQQSIQVPWRNEKEKKLSVLSNPYCCCHNGCRCHSGICRCKNNCGCLREISDSEKKSIQQSKISEKKRELDEAKAVQLSLDEAKRREENLLNIVKVLEEEIDTKDKTIWKLQQDLKQVKNEKEPCMNRMVVMARTSQRQLKMPQKIPSKTADIDFDSDNGSSSSSKAEKTPMSITKKRMIDNINNSSEETSSFVSAEKTPMSITKKKMIDNINNSDKVISSDDEEEDSANCSRSSTPDANDDGSRDEDGIDEEEGSEKEDGDKN